MINFLGFIRRGGRSAKQVLVYFEKSPLISYAIVIVAAVKVTWGMWLYRDLTVGDTSAYFVTALSWFHHFRDNILWSPLYTSFYGQMLFATHSAYGATILHRMVIVVVAAIGVLALMRRLMSPGFALLVALWWIALPINFNTLYEVHLFSLLPMLVVLIIGTHRSSAATRGTILALLFGITVLVRNEYVIALVLFALFCIFEELRRWRSEEHISAGRLLGLYYGIPLLLAVCLILFCYIRSEIKYPELSASAEIKHTLNMCQVYAFGYAQRFPEYTASPWTDCMPLMKTTFGKELPSLFQMIAANPVATLEHFLWNLSLSVNGFQVALFNAMSGTVNPDYAPVFQSPIWGTLFTLTSFLVLLGAVYRLSLDWERLKATLIEHRQFVALLLSLACVVIVVVATQRPRPSYLFAFSVCVMALIGMSAELLVRQFWKHSNAAALTTALIILVVLPYYQVENATARPLYTHLTRLEYYKAHFSDKGTKALIGDYAGELANYLSLGIKSVEISNSNVVTFPAMNYSVLDLWNRREPLEAFLEREGFNVFYIQPRIMAELRQTTTAKELLEGLTKWRRLNSPIDEDWALMKLQ